MAEWRRGGAAAASFNTSFKANSVVQSVAPHQQRRSRRAANIEPSTNRQLRSGLNDRMRPRCALNEPRRGRKRSPKVLRGNSSNVTQSALKATTVPSKARRRSSCLIQRLIQGQQRRSRHSAAQKRRSRRAANIESSTNRQPRSALNEPHETALRLERAASEALRLERGSRGRRTAPLPRRLPQTIIGRPPQRVCLPRGPVIEVARPHGSPLEGLRSDWIVRDRRT